MEEEIKECNQYLINARFTDEVMESLRADDEVTRIVNMELGICDRNYST